jgi:hypothetical protein
MDTNFAACIELYRSGKSADCIARLASLLADNPQDSDAQLLLALISNPPTSTKSVNEALDNLLAPDRRTADHYERLGLGFRAAGLEKLAEMAFKTAAVRDSENPEREHSWGDKPFNGQESRTWFFKELLKRVNVEAVVETGAFRGSTTIFLRETAGVDVHSCEISDRYFEYSSLRFAPLDGIHLYKADSRVFLTQLAQKVELTGKTVFFYLDAHWGTELPLVEELKLIFAHFKSPIIMVDDFEVPHRADYEFDDYGENKILSLDILEPVLRPELSLFYPDLDPDSGSGPKRGFVILTQGELAKSLGTMTGYVRKFDAFHAAIEQMRRYRKMFRQASFDAEATKTDLNAMSAELQQANLQISQQASRVSELEHLLDSVQRSRVWRGTRWLRGR